MEWTPLPIGVENYEEIIEKGYYLSLIHIDARAMTSVTRTAGS